MLQSIEEVRKDVITSSKFYKADCENLFLAFHSAETIYSVALNVSCNQQQN